MASTTSFAPPKDLRVEAWARRGYWKLRWSAPPGGDLRIERQTGPDAWESLGAVASEIGEFPLVVELPAGTVLRVSVSGPGIAPMVTELPIPQRTK